MSDDDVIYDGILRTIFISAGVTVVPTFQPSRLKLGLQNTRRFQMSSMDDYMQIRRVAFTLTFSHLARISDYHKLLRRRHLNPSNSSYIMENSCVISSSGH